MVVGFEFIQGFPSGIPNFECAYRTSYLTLIEVKSLPSVPGLKIHPAATRYNYIVRAPPVYIGFLYLFI